MSLSLHTQPTINQSWTKIDEKAFSEANEGRLIECTMLAAQMIAGSNLALYVLAIIAPNLREGCPWQFMLVLPIVWILYQLKLYKIARYLTFIVAVIGGATAVILFGRDSLSYLLFAPLLLAAFTLFGNFKHSIIASVYVLAALIVSQLEYFKDFKVLIVSDELGVMPIVFTLLSGAISYFFIQKFFKINLKFRTQSLSLVEHLQQQNIELLEREQELATRSKRLNDVSKSLHQNIQHAAHLESQLNASNEQLEQFAYAASHDLKEPLRSISSFIQVVQRKVSAHKDELLNDYFHHVVSSSRRMGKLLEDLLQYSRAGKLDAPVEQVSLGQVLNVITHEFRSLISEKSATINCESSDVVIHAPRGYVLAMLRELIKNSLVFCKAGVPPEICIRVKENVGVLTLSVSDNGVGVSEEYYEQVFHLFERLNRSEEYEGSGVGLALVKKIATQANVEIALSQSEPGGLCVSLSIPASPLLQHEN